MADSPPSVLSLCPILCSAQHILLIQYIDDTVSGPDEQKLTSTLDALVRRVRWVRYSPFLLPSDVLVSAQSG